MDILSAEELRELVEKRSPHSLSLFMPSHKTGEGMMQDPIRIKNLLKQAESSLREQGVRHIHNFLEPIEAKMNDKQFMQHMSDGLAVYHSNDMMTRFYRVPINFEELVTVNERFHIKPLLPLFSENGKFYILTLSQKKIRLFQGTRNTITELEVKDVPLSLEEFLKLDDYEKNQQFHTQTGPAPGEGTRPAMFFGQEADNEQNDQIIRWFREIDNVIAPSLNGDPLVLYGVEYLHPLYRKVNNYTALSDRKVTGNPDNIKPKEIHAKSWKVIEPHFVKARELDISKFHDLAGTGKTATTIDDALPAAAHGRIEVMFVPKNGHYWGTFNNQAASVKKMERRENGSEDLIDLTAVYTVVNSGKVYAVDQREIPGGGEVAGVFRY